MEYRYALMHTDSVGLPTYEWIYSVDHDGCPDVESIQLDVAAILCMAAQTDEEDIRSQILNYYFVVGIPEETYDYRHHTWNWHDHPDPRLLHHTSEEVVTDLNPNFAAAIITELHRFTNDIRDDYNIPIIPLEDDTPPIWEREVALTGGKLVHQGLRVYWIRYNIAAEHNTVEPFEDEHHTRFLPFYQGRMQIPNSDFTFQRTYETELNQMDSSKVHIDWAKKYLYVVPDAGVERSDVARFSLASASNDDVRLIAKVNHRDEYRFSSSLSGWRIRFDIQWQSGDWDDGITLALGFSRT